MLVVNSCRYNVCSNEFFGVVEGWLFLGLGFFFDVVMVGGGIVVFVNGNFFNFFCLIVLFLFICKIKICFGYKLY